MKINQMLFTNNKKNKDHNQIPFYSNQLLDQPNTDFFQESNPISVQFQLYTKTKN